MLLVVDNGSAFLGELLGAVSARHASLGCSEIGADLDGYDSFILSGRRRRDRGTNVVNTRIIRHCVAEGKPLLGICYGAEILALSAGGTLRRAVPFRRGVRTVRALGGNPVAGGSMSVFGSHYLEIARLPDSASCIASSDACRYEMIRLRGSSIFGTQFHPELTPDGRDMIGRFLEM